MKDTAAKINTATPKNIHRFLLFMSKTQLPINVRISKKSNLLNLQESVKQIKTNYKNFVTTHPSVSRTISCSKSEEDFIRNQGKLEKVSGLSLKNTCIELYMEDLEPFFTIGHKRRTAGQDSRAG